MVQKMSWATAQLCHNTMENCLVTQQAVWECKKALGCVTIQKLYRDLGVLECRLARFESQYTGCIVT